MVAHYFCLLSGICLQHEISLVEATTDILSYDGLYKSV